MTRDYRVFVHLESLEALPASGARRNAVVRFLRDLGSIAHLGGDFQVTDPVTSRRLQVSHVGGFAITWWIDGPAYEVKVVDVRTIAR